MGAHPASPLQGRGAVWKRRVTAAASCGWPVAALSAIGALFTAISYRFDGGAIMAVAATTLVAALFMARGQVQLKQARAALTGEIERRCSAEADLDAAVDSVGRQAALLHDAIEGLPDGFVLYDRDDRVVLANRRYSELHFDNPLCLQSGTRFEDIFRSGLANGEIDVPEDQVEALVRERLERHRNPSDAFEQRANGKWLKISERRTSDGGIVAIHSDVTALKKADAKLRESEERNRRQAELLQDAIDAIPDGFVLYDTEDRVVMCNRKFLEIRGVNPLSGKPGAKFADILRSAVACGEAPTPPEGVDAWVAKRVADRRAGTEPFLLKRRGRWIRMSEQRTRDGGIVSIHSDLTTLKEAQELLQAREEDIRRQATTLQDAIDALGDGLVLYDSDDRIVLFNRRYHELRGFHPSIFTGARFEDTVRGALLSGQIVMPEAEAEPWLATRLASHRNPTGPVLLQICGRWIRLLERKTHGGGTVSVMTDITDLKEAETKVRESAALLQDAVDALPDGVILYDKDDRLVLTNQRYREIHAYNAGSFTPGIRFEDVVRSAVASGETHMPDGLDVEEYVRRRIEQHRGASGSFIRESRGRYYRVAERRTRDGSIVGIRTDITDLKAAEAAAREGEERFRNLASNLPGVLFQRITTPDGTVRHSYFSDRVEELYGYTAEEMLANQAWLSEIVDPESRPMIQEIMKRSAGDLKPLEFEYRFRHRDGRSRWARAMVRPRRTAAGEITWDGVVFDITEHRERERDLKEAETKVRESAALLRDAIEAMPDGFVMYDAEDRVVLTNSKFRELRAAVPISFEIGARFEDIIRSAVKIYGKHRSDPEAWVQERLKQHRDLGTASEVRINRDSLGWNRISERRTSDGGTVAIHSDITELKQAEAAARESEERLRGIAANLPGLMYQRVQRADGTLAFTYMSDASAESNGFTGAQWREDKSVLNRAVPPQWQAVIDAAYRKSAHDLSPLQVEYEYFSKSGKRRWGRSIARPRRMPDGDTVWDGLMFDITQERKAEAKIRESEERFRNLASNLPGVLFQRVTTPEGAVRHTYYSDRVEDLCGYTAGEMLAAQSWLSEIVAPESRAMVQEILTRSVSDLKPVEFEYRLKHRDGRLLWAKAMARARRTSAGETIWDGFVFDITDQRERQRELEEARVRLQQQTETLSILIENLPVGVALIDRELRIMAFNKPYLEAIDLPPDFLHSGDPIEKVIRYNVARGEYGPGDPDKIVAERLAPMHIPKPRRYERGNGAHVIEIATRPLPTGGYVATFNDISEKRKMERQLAQAQKMEAVGQLTGGIAHDFNNLLGVIVGNLDQQIETLTSSAAAESIAAIKESGEEALNAALRGAELVQRLLAFSRNQPLQPKLLDLCEVLTGLKPLLQRSLGDQITVLMNCPDHPWPIYADPTQFESAILNLAINARDAMPTGGNLTITGDNVTLDEAAASATELPLGDYVTITVGDTGTGIPPEVLARVFEPFFTTKEVGKGSGLGLSMVFGYARQSGGTVKIYSEVGRGTDVCIYLPRARSLGKEEPVAAEETTVPSGNERILVVEDKAEVRTMAVRLLESLGYRTVCAENAAAALKVLEHDTEFDLLFTDIMMPGEMLGTDLARDVRRRVPDLPIIFTSGFSNPEAIVAQAMELGATILSKPYRKSQLAAQIRAALEQVDA